MYTKNNWRQSIYICLNAIMYKTLSKIALASATIAGLITLTACGGGGGGGDGQVAIAPTTDILVVPPQNAAVKIPTGVPGGAYPETLVYNQTLASMYTLSAAPACGAYDPYCRMVADKEGYVNVELDSSVTNVSLQVTTDQTGAIRNASVAENCDAACWQAASASSATLHLTGENTSRDGKNSFRIRVPAHVNNAKTFWLLSISGPVMQNDVSVPQTYAAKPLVRKYFESKPIKVAVFPMRINGVLPAHFPNIFQIAKNVGTRLPFAIADIRVADAINITSATTLGTIDEYSAALREFSQLSGATNNETYSYGIFSDAVRAPDTFSGAMRSAAIVGLGYQPGYSAIGWDDPSQWNSAMTHEMGHNFSLGHTPCDTGTANSSYPYPYGNLYAPAPAAPRYAFDLGIGLERADQQKDVMGYCGGQFFSDYSIAAMWKYLNPNAIAANKVTAAQAEPSRVAQSTMAKTSVFTVAELHAHWDKVPPTPIKIDSVKGQVYVWKNGTSAALQVRQLTLIPEAALPGLALEVQHADGLWYSGIAYRTSEESRMEFWSPGLGVPVAVRVKGL